MNRTTLHRLLLVLLSFQLASCASRKLSIKPAGFKEGLGHGLVSPFASIGKYIFRLNYAIYADYNTGFGYWSGFVMGVAIIILLFIGMRKWATDSF
jgi:hypothetical protein